MSIPCPYCGCADYAVFIVGAELDSSASYRRRFEGFEKLDYVMCRTCRLIYANPRLSYGDQTLNDLFPNHVTNRELRRLSEPDTPDKQRARVGTVADLLEGERRAFLEIGCGFGDAMMAAEELGFRAVGTELYQGYIDSCRTRGLDVRAGSVDGLPFDDASFDVVYMGDVLEHLKDPFAYLEEAARVLKPGGVLFVHTWAIGEPTNVVDAFGPNWRANRNLDLTAHTTIFPRELLKSFLVESGLEIVRANLIGELEDPARTGEADSHIQTWDFYCKRSR